MITKENFIDFIKSYREFESGIKRLEEAISGKPYGCCLYESDWCEAVGKMLDVYVDSHFTEVGLDLVFWWLFEEVDHIITQNTTPDLFNGKDKIEYNVNSIDDLWDYMIKFKKDYFNE